MWSVIGLVTLTSPVLIALFYPLLSSSGEDNDGGQGGRGQAGGGGWGRTGAQAESSQATAAARRGDGGGPCGYEELDAPVVGMDGVDDGGGFEDDDAELELMPLKPTGR
jgi:hypothetical protein